MKRLVLLTLIGFSGLFAGRGQTQSDAAVARKAPVWPLPKDTLALVKKAGLKAEPHEFFAYHVHAHLDIYVDGQSVNVPGGIGINIHDRGVQSGAGPSYGGAQCKTACISPLHTHGPDGVLHTESSKAHPNRLGQFFIEWNVKLTSKCIANYCTPHTRIAIYVNGKQYRSDPRNILLVDKTEIAMVIGKAPRHIPSKVPWA